MFSLISFLTNLITRLAIALTSISINIIWFVVSLIFRKSYEAYKNRKEHYSNQHIDIEPIYQQSNQATRQPHIDQMTDNTSKNTGFPAPTIVIPEPDMQYYTTDGFSVSRKVEVPQHIMKMCAERENELWQQQQNITLDDSAPVSAAPDIPPLLDPLYISNDKITIPEPDGHKYSLRQEKLRRC